MIKKFALLSFLTLALTACEDKIEPDERYKPLPETGAPMRTVLIEEYTGVYCPNCPTGHDVLKQIEGYYNTPANLDKGVGVIAVGIHIPAFGDPTAEGGYVTPEAASLSKNQNSAPAARINRRTEALGTDRWFAEVNSQIVRRSSVAIADVEAEFSGNTLSVSGSVWSDVIVDDAVINVWVVEDDIVDWQAQPDGSYKSDYVHHAVYRASLTGLRGRALGLNRNEATPFTVTGFPVSDGWNTSNLRVVVFVETPEGGVLNAAQAPVLISE